MGSSGKYGTRICYVSSGVSIFFFKCENCQPDSARGPLLTAIYRFFSRTLRSLPAGCSNWNDKAVGEMPQADTLRRRSNDPILANREIFVGAVFS